MCTSDTGFRSCIIYSGDKLFIARYVKTALLYLSLSGIDSHPSFWLSYNPFSNKFLLFISPQ